MYYQLAKVVGVSTILRREPDEVKVSRPDLKTGIGVNPGH